MSLREKTQERFKHFFEEKSKMHEGQEFEMAYSEIQQATGAANATLKRALELLQTDGWLEIKPGKNTRYGRFWVKGLAPEEGVQHEEDSTLSPPDKPEVVSSAENSHSPINVDKEFDELYHQIETLRRRIRTQEMTIALLQERLAEVEDKLHKR